MLEFASISTKGGLVLWSYKPVMSSLGNATDLLNSLVGDVLVEGRAASKKEYSYRNNYTVAYTLDNAHDLLTVVVAQKSIFPMLGYVDSVLTETPAAFRTAYRSFLTALKASDTPLVTESTQMDVNPATKFLPFTDTFEAILKKNVDSHQQQKKQPPKMKSFAEGAKAQKLRDKALKMTVDAPPDSNTTSGNERKSVAESRREFLQARRAGGKKSPSSQVTSGEDSAKDDVSPGETRKAKEKRNWDGGAGNKKAVKMKDLDRSTQLTDEQRAAQEQEEVEKLLQGVGCEGGGDIHTIGDGMEDSEEEGSEDEVNTPAAAEGKGFFANLFDGLTGNKALTRDDIDAALTQYREHLVGKNVASDVAMELCKGIEENLVGTKMSTIRGVKRTVRESLQASLNRILSSNRRVDIIRDIQLANAGELGAGKRPYVIAFCGVNGVGKSTNLAKVCYWLLHNNLTVTIAACDTFRAGAVEQLRVHQSALRQTISDPSQVELFDSGYGKDAAGVAAGAVKQATAMQRNVVLIDTAGRMQNNVPLMRSLAKLVNVNAPDLLLFVGEALVGNEAVDQLSKFNEALTDFSPSDSAPRLIDGMILTKFDTIDDKVGAAVSMTYTTGKPVIFVGTGQTYRDLKKLDIPTIVSTLLQ